MCMGNEPALEDSAERSALGMEAVPPQADSRIERSRVPNSLAMPNLKIFILFSVRICQNRNRMSMLKTYVTRCGMRLAKSEHVRVTLR